LLTAEKDDLDEWEDQAEEVLLEQIEEHEVQSALADPDCALQPIQILLQHVLPDHRSELVRARLESGFPVHIRGSPGVRAPRDHHQGGGRRHHSLQTGPRDQRQQIRVSKITSGN